MPSIFWYPKDKSIGVLNGVLGGVGDFLFRVISI